VPEEESRRRGTYYLGKVGLDGYGEAYPTELSGGMKQRAALARALAVEPDLLFMDEPFAGLDALTSANLREEVLTLWSDHALPVNTVVMVTHIIEEAVLMADRVLVLSSRPGRIVSDLEIALPRPRSKRDEGFDALVDSIFEKIV
jgi:NitT/TauT family transport system ATP-binding protein